jgi:hypothetical protein
LFALELIELMIAGKNILSIDEASFSQAAFYRSGWGFAGENMRHVTKPLGHRLTLTAAFDTDGKSYFAVSQATSDAERFCTFMYKLAKLLDIDNEDWRESTIIVLDGASIHRGWEARKTFAALRLPVVIAGPYGYDAAVVEKLHAFLKLGDLNPGNLKTGKR